MNNKHLSKKLKFYNGLHQYLINVLEPLNLRSKLLLFRNILTYKINIRIFKLLV